jgi:glutamate-1-semialdehyde 2,1-aminomutase
MTDSEKWFESAKKIIPGGVNSPVRAFQSVGLSPLFIRRAKGARLYDIDGQSYVDFVLSWGPMILGHAHPAVLEAEVRAAENGTSYGMPTIMEVDLARMITTAVPSIEMVRMVSSGTEAVMSAIRLARGFTGREKILKFEGCYHGHSDALLVRAGSGIATLGIPGSPGIPRQIAKLTITVPYNDLSAFESAMEQHGKDLACVIVEPVAGNMGVVPPEKGFLEALRQLSSNYGVLLIFDEVITGFRMTYGGYQNLVGIKPDLTCLGKIIGGGMPVGAFGGRRDIMSLVAPSGPVYQAGTLSGNPVAMAAGCATLSLLKSFGDNYQVLERRTKLLCSALEQLFILKGIPVRINRVGSMFTVFFTSEEVRDYASAFSSNTLLYARYFKNMLRHGVLMAPSQFEAAFVSFAHTDEDMEQAFNACEAAIRAL